MNMQTVHEVSLITGVSIRTLHHYDAIGLLKPAQVTTAGYRLYDETAIKRLQNILMFRELQFPLKEIKAILDSPTFNPEEALSQQIELLELRKKHLEELIAFARQIQKEGVNNMDFKAFQKTEIKEYEQEVKERWGSTKVYEEYLQKSKNKTDEEHKATANELLALFAEIGSLRPASPCQKEVLEKIGMLQAFITEHYYHCTDEILSGLGQMYVSDERMKRNIDQAGGDGTAVFVREAVSAYLRTKQV